MQTIEKTNILFEVNDVFGKSIRTTKTYWKKIFLIKHKELIIKTEKVIETIANPDEVRVSIQDKYIFLFYKKYEENHLVVVVKYFNNHGFVVTIYQTSNIKRKGEKIWPK